MKKHIILLAEIFLSAILFLIVCAMNGVGAAFCDGENHVYYLSASSQSETVITKSAVPAALLFSSVGGESAVITDMTRAELEEKYSASLVFEESASGVHNYYYYSPRFCRFVYIGGKAVNMHIAERGEYLCIGSPIIFGGY